MGVSFATHLKTKFSRASWVNLPDIKNSSGPFTTMSACKEIRLVVQSLMPL